MKRRKAIGLGALLAVAVAGGVFLMRTVMAGELPKGSAAPAWQLKNLDGKTINLSDFKGKVVILDFWATWCPPCRAEIPSFIALQKQYQSEGLQVVGISVDQGGVGTVKTFAQNNGINYPIVMATRNTSESYGGIEAIPTTFIIDREGKVVGQHVGLTDKSEFEAEIKPLLKGS